MDKKKIIIIASVVVLLLCAGLGYMVYSYMQENAEKEEMLKLAEMDKGDGKRICPLCPAVQRNENANQQ